MESGTINLFFKFFLHPCRAQIETNEGSEISTKTQSSDDTNSGQSGKGSQVLRKVDSSQEEQSKDTYVIRSS